MPAKWRSESIELNSPIERIPIPIVADGAIATRTLGEGRLIPLLIVDTTTRSDIDLVVEVHASGGLPGDVRTYWAREHRRSSAVFLILAFMRPVKATAALRLDLPKYASIVDQVVRSEALYFQPGRPGDRLKTSINSRRILIEVPSRDFVNEWEAWFLKATEREFRNRGLGRQAARRAAPKAIEMIRRVGDMRMRPKRSGESE